MPDPAPEPQARWFVELGDACDAAGLRLEIQDGPTVAVVEPNGDSYSRHVQPGETYDRCAEIVLRGLRRSRVLPPRRRAR